MRIGVDYYPEQWDRKRWNIDAEMMRKAGIRLIRIAEFAWSLSEKTEGSYDFSWIDEIVGLFSSYGIRVILCTPTATPPKWLIDKYPSVLQEDKYNHKRGFGSRRHYCFNSEIYIEKCSMLVERMAKHFADNDNIEAWQIDNEFGCQDTVYCYCDDCLKAFKEWLRAKYVTIEALNKSYGTVFWNQTYNSFDELIIPKASTCENSCPDIRGQNPSLFLDYKRFSSDSVIAFQKIQADIIKRYSKAPVTTNLMGSYPEIDYFRLAKDLDFVSWDNYLDTQWGRGYAVNTSMDHALMRSLKKKPMWVMEQQSGPCGWGKMGANPEPGKLRLWTYQSIANGADTVVYFRWRAALFGTEQYWHGILNHDGVPNRRYEEISKTGAEIDRLNKIIPALDFKPKVAIIKHYDTIWSHYIQPHADGFSYDNMLCKIYDTLYGRGINVNFADPYEDLSQYKLVFAPALNLADDIMVKNFEKYVADGGKLVLTYRSGTRKLDNTMYELPAPGAFMRLVGASASDFDPQAGRSVSVSGIFGKSVAKIWCDILEPETAMVIGSYTGSHYCSKAAVTENTFGKGTVYYIGCDLEPDALWKLNDYILKSAGIEAEFRYPIYNVEISEAVSGGRKIFFILNHNDETAMLRLEHKYKNLLDGKETGEVLTLQAYDTAVLERV